MHPRRHVRRTSPMTLRMGVYPLLSILVGPIFAAAATSTATPSATPAGVTPRFLGFNNGHFRSTSNTAAWVDYAGINAMRVWAAENDYLSTTEPPTYGDGVTTQSDFDAVRSSFRSAQESSPYWNNSINWSKTQTGRNNINLDYVLSQLQSKGVDVLLQSTRSTAYDYTGWGGKWEQWKWYYQLAYWAGKNYDVQRFQMYNEPDLANISQSEWVDRMKVASDAIRAAINDVNLKYNKSLSPDVYAPVAAGTTSTLDTWGKLALNSNRTDFEGNPTNYDIFNVYDVHRYNSTGSTFASDQTLFDSKIPSYNQSHQNLPVTYSEFNRQNTSSFSSSPNSLDTPSVYTEFAAILTGAMSQDVRGMYAFKFSQTYWTNSSGVDEPMKTGFYYVDDAADAHSTDTHNTTGATQGAEVMRLADKAFKGERPRYAINTNNSTNDAAGSFDADARRYYYFSVNRATAAADVTLNLSNWNVAAGQTVTVEEVSANHHGDVSRSFVVPANKTLTFSQTAQSLFLLTIPAGAGQSTVDLPAAADATVSNANPGAANGSSPVAYVARDAAGNNDEATYLKFSLAGQSQPAVSRALLRLTGQNIANGSPTTLHVYGLLNDAWSESTLTWSNAPDLASSTDSALANVGTDAFPLGQLTYDSAEGEYAVDITDFVRRHPDSTLTFAVLREQRFAGDADTSRIQLKTRGAASGQPRLSLSLYANPVYNWRLNANGALTTPANLDVHQTPNSPGAVLNLGQFITSPHTVSLPTPVTLGTLNFNNFNSYTLNGPAVLTFDNNGAASAINVYQGSHKIDAPLAFALPATLNISADASLDIAASVFSLSTPAPTIRQYLAGRQLFSSLADPSHAVGYAPVAGGSLLVRLTLTGDANLDGMLDGDDFALIDRGMRTGGTFWYQGDFNYDGQITGADYLLLDSAYLSVHPASSTLLAERESQFGAGYVAQLVAAVPEPLSLSSLLSPLSLLLFRRARRAT